MFAMVETDDRPYQGAGRYVVGATRDVATGKITIYLNKVASAFPYPTQVAWFVLDIP